MPFTYGDVNLAEPGPQSAVAEAITPSASEPDSTTLPLPTGPVEDPESPQNVGLRIGYRAATTSSASNSNSLPSDANTISSVEGANNKPYITANQSIPEYANFAFPVATSRTRNTTNAPNGT